MKLKLLLITAFAALLLSGCGFAVSSQNSGRNETPSAENASSGIKGADLFGEANQQKNTADNRKPPKKAPLSNAVCPHPDKPCHHKEKQFAEWELPFRLPAKIQPNKTISSAPFYAVLLKTYDSVEDCDGGEYIEEAEAERKRLQNLQLERKVFASYGCPNMDAVSYDFEGRYDAAKEMVLIDNFIAIYAGETKEEAEQLRKQMLDEYPKAVVKRMTANWERIEQ
ncbi:MAG TPA: hypothetical protein VK892_15115 [Pyrinomonadaceae bacterium]|nr:hypothetical protein [Pyrinomonadaceae bacterium]